MTQVKNVIHARLAKIHVLVLNLRILHELRQALIKPKRHPIRRAFELHVGVFVIHGREWMFILCAELQENVVFILGVHVVPAQLHLALCQIRGRFHRVEDFLIFRGNYNDGFRGIDVCFGKERLEYPTHSFELIGDVAAVLLIRVCQHGEVCAANFRPLLGRSAMAGRQRAPANISRQRNRRSVGSAAILPQFHGL